MEHQAIISHAKQVVDIEIEGLSSLREQINDNFVKLVEACNECLNRNGKIVVTGVGKSGHVASKIAATLSSTGSPSIFMNPLDALHGDLGVLVPGDILLALSYSGETSELTRIILPAKRLGVKVVSFTKDENSSLAKLSDIVVTGQIKREACPFNLAPTASSTVQIAFGDALAMTLLKSRNFTKEDYGKRHPEGAIGRAVTLRIRDCMRTGKKMAVASPSDSVMDALIKMTKARCGCAIIVDGKGLLAGIFTDGDFRRCISKDLSVLQKHLDEVMTRNPVKIIDDALALEAFKILEKKHIDDIAVVNESGKAVGLVDIQDLPRFKIM